MRVRIYFLTKVCENIFCQRNMDAIIDLEKDYKLVLEFECKDIDLQYIFLEMNNINISNDQRSLSVNDIIAVYDGQWRYYIINLCGFTKISVN